MFEECLGYPVRHIVKSGAWYPPIPAHGNPLFR